MCTLYLYFLLTCDATVYKHQYDSYTTFYAITKFMDGLGGSPISFMMNECIRINKYIEIDII